MKFSKIYYSEIISGLSLLIVVIFAIYGTPKDCSQELKIDKITFWNTAIRYRPMLKVITPIKVDSFAVFGSKKIAVRDMFLSQDSVNRVIDIPTKIRIQVTLKVANISPVLAKVYGIVWTDTTTQIDRIREKILTGDSSNFINSIDSSNFHFIELFPNDTAEFSENRVIDFIKDNRFTIHFYVLYANELKNLYDSYEWITFETRPIISVPEFRIYQGNLQVRLVPEDPTYRNVFKIVETRSSSEIFSEDQSKKIYDVLNSFTPFKK